MFFFGKKNAEEIAKILQTQDVFAWPSLTDTFGLVVLEAMACGLPVAAFDNEVNRYIIENNKSGILGEDLENNILYASEIPKENAIQRATKFSWEKATDQFISYIV